MLTNFTGLRKLPPLPFAMAGTPCSQTPVVVCDASEAAPEHAFGSSVCTLWSPLPSHRCFGASRLLQVPETGMTGSIKHQLGLRVATSGNAHDRWMNAAAQRCSNLAQRDHTKNHTEHFRLANEALRQGGAIAPVYSPSPGAGASKQPPPPPPWSLGLIVYTPCSPADPPSSSRHVRIACARYV